MYRRRIPTSAELQRLLDQRTDLLVQLSLEKDTDAPNAARISEMTAKILSLDAQIEEHRRIF
jgi:hypothetical protein